MLNIDASTALNQLADKAAVIDALYRFAAGIDLRDKSLLVSSFAADAISDFRPAGKKAGFDYPVLEGRDIIVASVLGALAQIDTTHSVSNPRVTVDGDKAHLKALIEAQHVSSSNPSHQYLMKNRYEVDLVRQDDVWVIKHMVVDNVWRTGDSTVLTGMLSD